MSKADSPETSVSDREIHDNAMWLFKHAKGLVTAAVALLAAGSIYWGIVNDISTLRDDVDDLMAGYGVLQQSVGRVQGTLDAMRADVSVLLMRVNTSMQPRDGKISLTSAQLRRIRGRLGLTQQQMGHALGVTSKSVQRWETGRQTITESRAMQIIAFADRVGVFVDIDTSRVGEQ